MADKSFEEGDALLDGRCFNALPRLLRNSLLLKQSPQTQCPLVVRLRPEVASERRVLEKLPSWDTTGEPRKCTHCRAQRSFGLRGEGKAQSLTQLLVETFEDV